MNKRGENILTENIIFIILNLVFLGILILFIFTKMQTAANLEEVYAKQIALMIDSAQPITDITFDMKDGFDTAKDEGYAGKLVSISENVVTVRLRDDGGYSYSFFNDVDVSVLDIGNNKYVFKINEYN